MPNLIAFPDHQIDPKKKDKNWILQFCKAAQSNWQVGMPTGSIFMARAAEYLEERDYSMGRQSIEKHKKELLPEDENDESFTKISWEPRQDGVVLLNIAVAKVQKAGYNILATPINPMAKDAQDQEYAKAKVKIMMREAAKEQGAPELANHPSLKKLPGEADDLEELQMEMDFNPKFIRAKDIEESVQLVFYENEADKLWDLVAEDIVYHGAGIVKDDLDENNKVILRKVDLSQFACSFSKKPDFSDITWAYEVNSVKISDLSKYFDKQDIEKLVNRVMGQNGNPNSMGANRLENNGYDIYKADVMEIEFLSWNQRVTEENKDKFGNTKIAKVKPSAINTTYKDANGNEVAKKQKDSVFTAKTIEVKYKAKWVIGTDLIYNFGLANNTPRTVNIATMGKTKLSYHIQAANFSHMRAKGLVAGMKSVIDDINVSLFKMRMLKNRIVANGFDIDLAAIENVALGAKGQVMSPKDVINLFYETGTLISRRSGIGMDSNVNYKAIQPITNSQAEQLIQLAQDIQNSKQALRDITGLNELTDGSTPNPKTLTTIANMANESTNNALFSLINTRRNLIESTAKAVVQRLQVALKRGAYDGFNKADGRWVTVPKSILDYDYDIMIEDKPSDDQKQWLYDLVREDIKNGFLDVADVITIINTNNIKQAQILLAFRVKKNKEKQQQMSLQNTQANGQQQQQSLVLGEQIKLQADAARHKMKMEEIDLMQSWQYLIMGEKNGQANDAAQLKAGTEIAKINIANGQPMGQSQPQEPPQAEQAEPQQEPAMQEQAEQ